MLVNMTKMLQECKSRNKAVIAFNVYNLETILAVFETANHLKTPVIIAFGEKDMSYAPMEVIACIVSKLSHETETPIALHLDHAQRSISVLRAIRCGFTSIMYDGSRLDLKANIKQTRSIVEMAQPVNISVEGELGWVKMQDEQYNEKMRACMTWPEHARLFVEKTGVDALAVAIGTAHGVYKGEPKLDLERLEEIAREVPNTPLVLHGCSGLSDELLKECIVRGVAKININTEISRTALRKASEVLSAPIDETMRFEHVLLDCRIEMARIIKHYLNLCSL